MLCGAHSPSLSPANAHRADSPLPASDAGRWHGKCNMDITLKQLQRTGALVFPEEVAKNGETEGYNSSTGSGTIYQVFVGSKLVRAHVGGEQPSMTLAVLFTFFLFHTAASFVWVLQVD